MKRLIRKILREEINRSDKYYRFLDKISSIIEPPYFRNMYEKTNGGFWDITDEGDQEYILKNIYGDDIIIMRKGIYTLMDGVLYREFFDGDWEKWEHNDKGKRIYYENNHGSWIKYEYDDKGDRIYREDSDGYWEKYEYDNNGNVIYYENSHGKKIYR